MRLTLKLGLSLGAVSATVGSTVVVLTTQNYAHANNIPQINREGYDFSGVNPYGYRDEVAGSAIKLDTTRPGYHKHTYTAADFKENFKDFKSYQGPNTPGVPDDPHYDIMPIPGVPFKGIQYLPAVDS